MIQCAILPIYINEGEVPRWVELLGGTVTDLRLTLGLWWRWWCVAKQALAALLQLSVRLGTRRACAVLKVEHFDSARDTGWPADDSLLSVVAFSLATGAVGMVTGLATESEEEMERERRLVVGSFYIVATSNDISGRVLICDSAHL